jgi:peroxiredoxin
MKKVLTIAVLVAIAVAVVVLVAQQKGHHRPTIVREGDEAPVFRLPSLDGGSTGPADFRGKVVMVHFWATWCPPCVEEIPTLDRLARSLRGPNFELLAVSVDEGGAPAVREFLQARGLTLPVLLDSDHSVAASYGTFRFPETYILDRRGIVRYKVIGAANWDNPQAIKAVKDLIAAN